MPTLSEEVLRRLNVSDDAADLAEGWLAFVLGLHAQRVANAGWRAPGEPRKVRTDHLEKLHERARVQVGVVVAELERLGFTVDLDAVDRAIADTGSPEQAAAGFMRSVCVSTHAERRAEWLAEDARRAAASPIAALRRAAGVRVPC